MNVIRVVGKTGRDQAQKSLAQYTLRALANGATLLISDGQSTPNVVRDVSCNERNAYLPDKIAFGDMYAVCVQVLASCVNKLACRPNRTVAVLCILFYQKDNLP